MPEIATTRIVPIHVGKARSVSSTLRIVTDYDKNPNKTDAGRLVSCYECDAETVDAQFLLSKKLYYDVTGRTQPKKNDVLAYQIRQAFLPGELTPEQANKIGYELAERLTKGKHQFIVCTHVDKAHIHNHIAFCANSIDGTHKFKNFWGSSFVIRKLSDQLCIENQLFVIANPKSGNTEYGTWLKANGESRPPTNRQQLQNLIGEVMTENPSSFEDFLDKIAARDCTVKRGKHTAIRLPQAKRFIRLDSLGAGYSDEAIRKGILEVSKEHPEKAKQRSRSVNLLVDIQAKLKAGKGAGYERWAKVFNLKQMAKTLSYLQEHDLLEYTVLERKAATATERFQTLSDSIKSIDTRLQEISDLESAIITYAQTREVYVAYRKAGYSRKFYSVHEQDIIRHQSVKRYFTSLNMKKLPKIKELKAEYSELLSKKRSAYSQYKDAKREMQEVSFAKANVDQLLGIPTSETRSAEKPSR